MRGDEKKRPLFCPTATCHLLLDDADRVAGRCPRCGQTFATTETTGLPGCRVVGGGVLMTGVGCALAIGSVVLMYGGSGASRLAQYAGSGLWLGLGLGSGGLLVAVSALLLMAWSAL